MENKTKRKPQPKRAKKPYPHGTALEVSALKPKTVYYCPAWGDFVLCLGVTGKDRTVVHFQPITSDGSLGLIQHMDYGYVHAFTHFHPPLGRIPAYVGRIPEHELAKDAMLCVVSRGKRWIIDRADGGDLRKYLIGQGVEPGDKCVLISQKRLQELLDAEFAASLMHCA